MIKDYIIKERLGTGAFGIVYKVLKQTNNYHYVIKQIPLFGLTQKQINDAKLEAKILSAVKSIYIVRYYESFEENNYLNIVMEYCDGGDLSHFIEKNKETGKFLEENLVWNIFIKITIGLAALHKSKILHRDLKSLNIFLTKNLDIKIGDFGVAKILTATGFAKTIIGTPYYLSPELCDELPYNDKSDVWALGCILYELCTYDHPFNAQCQASLILKIIQKTPEPINDIYSDNLKKLVNIILDKNHLTRPSCYEILNLPFIIDKAKELGLYEKIKCLYPDLPINKTKENYNNLYFKSYTGIDEVKNSNNNIKKINGDKKVLHTEEVKNVNYNKVVMAKEYIKLNYSSNNRNKSKDKSKEKKVKNNLNINIQRIKDRIERSKSCDINISKSKSKEKKKKKNNNISHRFSESKSKSKKRKSKVNKSTDNLDKYSKIKNKTKNRLLKLLKSKTPPRYNSNYLSLNQKILNEISKNDIPFDNKNKKGKNKDKIIYNQFAAEEKKLINMKEFANFLNNYVNYHNKQETIINKSNNNKKNISKEKLNFKINNYNEKNRSKEKIKTSKPPQPSQRTNFSKYYEKIGTNMDNNGVIHQEFFNNASINIYNNINNIQINNINNLSNLNIKENNKKSLHKINSHKYIVYNQKKIISNTNNNASNNIKNNSNKSKDKKRIDFVYKKNKNNSNNIYDELKRQRKILKNTMLNLLGKEDYNQIIGLYEKTYQEEDKAQEYFEYIEQYVKLKIDPIKKEKFDSYFENLMSIDCHLNIK